jgi:hypothetical protein
MGGAAAHRHRPAASPGAAKRAVTVMPARHNPGREEVGRALADDGIVSAIVQRCGRLIGLWTEDPDDR